MGNIFVVLTTLIHGLVKLAGLTPQTIETEPGIWMNVWVPKEIVTKIDGKIVYVPPTKPPVLLLHSFAMDGIFTWFFQVLALTREYSVYVPDFLFFGGSITDSNERSASFQAQFVAKELEKLRVEKVTLVGLSYGGMVGFKMAKLYPKLVKSMVMSGTVIEMTETMFSVGFHKVPWLPDFVYQYILETMFNNRKERNELLRDLVVRNEDALDSIDSQMWGDDDKIFDLGFAINMKIIGFEKLTGMLLAW